MEFVDLSEGGITSSTGSQSEKESPSIEMETSVYYVFEQGKWSIQSIPLVMEAYITLYINGKELITMMGTPYQQEYLALGFLYTEGLIQNRQDILEIKLAPNNTCVDIWLKNGQIELPKRRIITSGCGNGVTFSKEQDFNFTDLFIGSGLSVEPGNLQEMMISLLENASLYKQTRGMHAAGLASRAGLVIAAEDVGRHNTIDKIAGYCLLNDIDASEHVLLSTGRISSEMLIKAGRMKIPIIASRSAPTSLSVKLAQDWGITLVGYLRPNRMQVYSHPYRLKLKEIKNES